MILAQGSFSIMSLPIDYQLAMNTRFPWENQTPSATKGNTSLLVFPRSILITAILAVLKKIFKRAPPIVFKILYNILKRLPKIVILGSKACFFLMKIIFLVLVEYFLAKVAKKNAYLNMIFRYIC